MRAVVQRVMKASVSVDDEVVSSIGRGICVLLGISRDDTHKDIDYMVNKILKLRVFEDDYGARWKMGVGDKHLEILCVSQFTLTCTLKGNKPDFHTSMEPNQSQAMYEDFLLRLKAAYKPELVKDGRFGAYMQVSIQNDGPVTMQIDSPVHLNKNNKVKKKANSEDNNSSDNNQEAAVNELSTQVKDKLVM